MRIAHGPNQKLRGGIGRRILQIAAHRNTIAIAFGNEIECMPVIRFKAPATEDQYANPRAGCGIGLFPGHGAENLISCVLARPHCGQASGRFLCGHNAQRWIINWDNIQIVPVW
jgi:hypothetical protein